MTIIAERRSHVSNKCKLHSALILSQLLFSGFQILSRLALLQGAGQIVFSFYRNCIASLLLGILGFIIERRKRPALTFITGCKFFFLGFIGVTLNQVFYLAGMRYTSAVFASAMRNITPVITFILAVVCGMESLSLRRLHGQARVLGCMFAICGSILLSVYKGPVVLKSKLSILPAQHIASISHHSYSMNAKRTIKIFWLISITMQSWQLGSIFIIASCFSFAVFLVLQAPVLKKYPAPISFAAFACFSSVLQLPILALIFEPQRSNWRPASVTEVISIVYAGLVASGVVSGIHSWAVFKGGPVIVATYQPLDTVVTAFLSSIFLRESLHLGSIIGGFLVICGLYLLIWGQEKERPEISSSSKPVSSAKVSDNPELPQTVVTMNAVPFAAEVTPAPPVLSENNIAEKVTTLTIAADILADETPQSPISDEQAVLETALQQSVTDSAIEKTSTYTDPS